MWLVAVFLCVSLMKRTTREICPVRNGAARAASSSRRKRGKYVQGDQRAYGILARPAAREKQPVINAFPRASAVPRRDALRRPPRRGSARSPTTRCGKS